MPMGAGPPVHGRSRQPVVRDGADRDVASYVSTKRLLAEFAFDGVADGLAVHAGA